MKNTETAPMPYIVAVVVVVVSEQKHATHNNVRQRLPHRAGTRIKSFGHVPVADRPDQTVRSHGNLASNRRGGPMIFGSVSLFLRTKHCEMAPWPKTLAAHTHAHKQLAGCWCQSKAAGHHHRAMCSLRAIYCPERFQCTQRWWSDDLLKVPLEA